MDRRHLHIVEEHGAAAAPAHDVDMIAIRNSGVSQARLRERSRRGPRSERAVRPNGRELHVVQESGAGVAPEHVEEARVRHDRGFRPWRWKRRRRIPPTEHIVPADAGDENLVEKA